MYIRSEQLDNNTLKVTLEGRMDLIGTQEIEATFSDLSALPRQTLIVDCAGVDFLASVGIRTLLVNAKAVDAAGGRLVLLNPTAHIENILVTAGVDTLIPIYKDLASAMAVV